MNSPQETPETAKVKRKLGDAYDLLKMIEHVVENCDRSDEPQVPWAGLKLTIRQCRELIRDSYAGLGDAVRVPVEPEAFPAEQEYLSEESAAPARASTRRPARSIASRIRQLPVVEPQAAAKEPVSQVRELRADPVDPQLPDNDRMTQAVGARR